MADGYTTTSVRSTNQLTSSGPVNTTGASNLSEVNAQSNPLSKFQTFNCIFTLACLDKQTQNSGKIKKENISNIVCRTAGDWGNENKRVKLDFGTFDYFIDDVIISSIPTLSKSTGNSFATKVSFNVHEPYSMGLFLLAIQRGAYNAGYTTNFKEASYLFMIEFVGNMNDMPTDINAPSDLTRYIPIKIISLKFKVTASGSLYEVIGVPYNEHAFRDQIARIPTDIQLNGNTVEQLLIKGDGSLMTAIAKRTANLKAERKVTQYDSYEIQFPLDFSQEGGDSNIISKSNISDKLDTSGTIPFPTNTTVFDDVKQIYKNRILKLDDKKNWHFTQEATIPDIITEIIIHSDYIINQVTNANYLVDSRGMLNWFRIETQIKDGEESAQLGRQLRTYIYRVVPYKVHISKLLPPNAKPPGYDILKNTVSRVYDYIYTGKNTEILSVDIDFDFAYFAPVPHDVLGRVGQNIANQGSITASAEELEYMIPQTADTNNIMYGFGQNILNSGGLGSDQTQSYLLTGQTPRSNQEVVVPLELMSTSEFVAQRRFQYKGQGGAGTDTEQTSQARTLQAMLTNDADMIRLNMVIMGDPYYLPSSGMGNQIIKAKTSNILEDGSMNYQEGEVDIILNFRTPIDLDPVTGLYKFDKEISLWSGLYQVIEVESKINQNKFTQTIRAFRRRTQLGGKDKKTTIVEYKGTNENKNS